METQKAAILLPNKKEKQIIVMLKNGMNGDEIAEKTGVNKNTFAFSLKVLRSKYQCKNTVQLVAFFIENNLLD